MHLDNKAFLTLSSPFIIAGGIWFFAADSLLEGLQYFFEPVQKQQIPILEEKGQIYTLVTANKNEYVSLLKKFEIRRDNQFWISERLYVPYSPPITAIVMKTTGNSTLKAPPPLLKFSEGNITAVVSSAQALSVQMVLPQQNMAIINNRIMRVGQSIDGVKLLSVDSSKVHIQTTKGSQWVKLFH